MDNLAFSHLPSTMGRVGAVAASAEILKRRKYRNLVEIYVFGSGLGPMGPWGPIFTLFYRVSKFQSFKRSIDAFRDHV